MGHKENLLPLHRDKTALMAVLVVLRGRTDLKNHPHCFGVEKHVQHTVCDICTYASTTQFFHYYTVITVIDWNDTHLELKTKRTHPVFYSLRRVLSPFRINVFT